MRYNEQKLQMQCVSWFRAQYPQYAMLLTHPINEGGKNTARTGGIHKAEGAVAGVPDLILFMTGVETLYNDQGIANGAIIYHALGIEFKTLKGKQSQEQKDFQRMFEAAQYKYVIIRTFEEFKNFITNWISTVHPYFRKKIAAAHVEIVQAAEQREKEKFYKIIGKK